MGNKGTYIQLDMLSQRAKWDGVLVMLDNKGNPVDGTSCCVSTTDWGGQVADARLGEWLRVLHNPGLCLRRSTRLFE